MVHAKKDVAIKAVKSNSFLQLRAKLFYFSK